VYLSNSDRVEELRTLRLAHKEGDTAPASMLLQGSYNYGLVTLSVALAIVASYAATDLAGRLGSAHGPARLFWLSGGAISMGLGIWAMHYIGMLAFILPVPVLYHYPTVMLSLLAAMFASAVALLTVSRPRPSLGLCGASSLMMGGGIAAMHYTGMAAMRLPAMMEYRPGLVLLSILVGVAVSFAAILLANRFHSGAPFRAKVTSALVMGSAIPLTHYMGMWAVRFRACDAMYSTRSTIRVSSLGIVVISVTTFVVLLLAILVAFVDRVISLQTAAADAARDNEARFHTLAEAIPQIVWTTDADGLTNYINQHWYEMTGMPPGSGIGSGWMDVVHPDDREVCREKWRECMASGKTFEVEYRLRDCTKEFRWYLDRAVPLHDASGAIQQWFGTCTDIEQQKRQQQILEEQVKEHTAALMEANLRLEAEMRERALAQQELNQQNERMLNELTVRSNRATTLVKTAELLQSCGDLNDLLGVVAGMSPKMFPELRGAALLLNSSRDGLEVAASWADCRLAGKVFGPQDCWALRTGQKHLVSAGDPTAECRHVLGDQHSYLCLPLLSQGDATGVLHFQAIDSQEMPQSLMLMVNMFAEQVGLSISNLRLREALLHQSIRDPLTGLFNRRYLEETLEREVRRATRSEQTLGVLLLDLDHFKRFNDTYGHDAGDTVLRETAAFLTTSVRAEDIVCRFGGEEFVIILPMADLKATHARAQRICSKLRDLTVLHRGNPIGAVTVSVGVAALPEHGAEPRTLVEAADAAMYRAKKEGRDRVVVADPNLNTETSWSAVAGKT
jgi:diguanylate cyclase (GGDEF)-like protein/PAS domain S-box-containing protein